MKIERIAEMREREVGKFKKNQDIQLTSVFYPLKKSILIKKMFCFFSTNLSRVEN